VPLARLEAAIARDKKARAGAVRWVLTPKIGSASVPRSIAPRIVRAAWVEAGTPSRSTRRTKAGSRA
jgi:hypothetical protein